MVVEVTGKVPDPASLKSAAERQAVERALDTWDCSRAWRSRISASTAFLSDHAPTRVSAICARRPTSCADTRLPRA